MTRAAGDFVQGAGVQLLENARLGAELRDGRLDVLGGACEVVGWMSDFWRRESYFFLALREKLKALLVFVAAG